MSLRLVAANAPSRAFRSVSRWFAARREAAALGAFSSRDLADLGLSHAPDAAGLDLVGCERARRQRH
jgi:hypothetical protein